MALEYWTSAGFQELWSGDRKVDSAKDVNKEMLWFSSTRRKLNFRNFGQETESYDVDEDLNKEMLWIWSTG